MRYPIVHVVFKKVYKIVGRDSSIRGASTDIDSIYLARTMCTAINAAYQYIQIKSRVERPHPKQNDLVKQLNCIEDEVGVQESVP